MEEVRSTDQGEEADKPYSKTYFIEETMRYLLLFLTAACIFLSTDAAPSPCQSLDVWPLPKRCNIQHEAVALLTKSTFSTHISAPHEDGAHDLLAAALSRFEAKLFDVPLWKKRGDIEPHLLNGTETVEVEEENVETPAINVNIDALHVSVLERSDRSKQVNSDESYEVSIDKGKVTITALTAWGAIYGLETVKQLVERHVTSRVGTSVVQIPYYPLHIQDSPSFPWRGLMLDTVNHFFSVATIERLIDGLAINKMNVLHWHLFGSYSFPFASQTFPNMTERGSWDGDRTTYTHSDISHLTEFARVRGVRIVLEIDLPGHCYAWGMAFPEILSSCPAHLDTDIGAINSVPLNPISSTARHVIDGILSEVAPLFQDEYFHAGGDELQYDCWKSDQNIEKYMKQHNITSFGELHASFEDWYLQRIAKNWKKSIVWEETFEQLPANILPRKSVVVEVWSKAEITMKALEAGYDVILANGYYLDRQVPVDNVTAWFWLDTWVQMYAEPLPVPPPRAGKLLGAEANMWTEQVSEVSIDSRVWPRAAALAERLWSNPIEEDGESRPSLTWLAAQRLAVLRCRMSGWGIPTGPIWPDFCSADQTYTSSVTYDLSADDSNEKVHHLTTTNIATIVLLVAVFFSIIASYTVVRVYQNYFIPTHEANLRGEQRERERMQRLEHVDEKDRVESPKSAPMKSPSELEEPLLSGLAHPSSSSSPKASSLSAVGVAAGGSSAPRGRVSSLDVFRGFTVALMILVDEAGAAFPLIDHSPWNGVTLADFVMPFFDFIVGISIALSFKKFDVEQSSARRTDAVKRATVRSFKLFLLGMWTQGCINIFTCDMSHIRIMGILQRVAVCYYISALMDIFLPRSVPSEDVEKSSTMLESILRMFSTYKYYWLVALSFCAIHTGVLYGVEVPPIPEFNLQCGRGELTPPCNAATYLDRHLLTVPHMYFPTNGGDLTEADMTFQRLPECSSCSPGRCIPPLDAPLWCFEGPFDPEGLVSSLTAVVTTMIGLHYGHVLVRIQDPVERLWHWGPFSVLQLVVGIILHFSGAPMNTDLYSLAYLFVTAGTGGLVLCFFYFVVDMKNNGRLLNPFKWMGMNAISMYVLAEGGIIQAFLSVFYFDDPDKNLTNILYPTGVYWGDSSEPRTSPSHNVAVLFWVLAYIGIWMVVSYLMFKAGKFIKI